MFDDIFLFVFLKNGIILVLEAAGFIGATKWEGAFYAGIR